MCSGKIKKKLDKAMKWIKEKKKLLWILLAVILVAGGVTGFVLYESSLVYGVCYVEAGVEVTAQDFLKKTDPDATFTAGEEELDVHIPGAYPLKIKTGLFSHKTTLYVSDTTAPVCEARAVNLVLGQTCEVEDFVESYQDETEVTISFRDHAPDFSKPGSQNVELELVDLGENLTTLQTTLYVSPAVSELTMEAGDAFPALSEFVLAEGTSRFVTDLGASIDPSTPGDYEVVTCVDEVEGTTILHVVDTKAPVVITQDVESYAYVTRIPEDFISEVADETQVVCSFVTDPALDRIGTQQVQVCVTDAGGNETIAQSSLTLLADEEAPVITGVKDLTVFVGIPFSYKKHVTVTDNCMEQLDFQIENTSVDVNTPGTYPIAYVATDAAGNETRVEATVTVCEQKYSEDEVNALADEVLASILKEGMTDYEKTEAIFNYIVSHVGYINHSDKGNWIQGAYEGLAKKQGDCYVYACISKVLLTRAGIENMDIEKIPAKSSHYWNLVNLGTGWYHFDTTPRRPDHPRIFMWTEDQLMDYSNRHRGSHNYDHSQYPEVNTIPYSE